MNSLFWVMGLSGGRLVLDIDELADALGLAKQTVYNQLSDGTLPVPTRKQGKRIFADARDVAEYLDSERDKAREVHRMVQSRNSSRDALDSMAKSHRNAPDVPPRGSLAHARMREEKMTAAIAAWRADMQNIGKGKI